MFALVFAFVFVDRMILVFVVDIDGSRCVAIRKSFDCFDIVLFVVAFGHAVGVGVCSVGGVSVGGGVCVGVDLAFMFAFTSISVLFVGVVVGVGFVDGVGLGNGVGVSFGVGVGL